MSNYLRSLVASGAQIRLDDRGDAQKLSRARQPWQQVAFNYLPVVGELSYVTAFVGDTCAKMRLYPAMLDDEGRPKQTADERAVAALKRIDRGAGHAGILRKAAINLMVVGECFLVGMEVDGEDEDWRIRSINELKVGGSDSYELREVPGGEGRPLAAGGAVVFRIWLEDPEYGGLATSPTRAALEHCETLIFLGKTIRSQAKSRIPLAKILKVPDELTGGPPDPTTDGAGDGEERKDPFMADLEKAMVTPIQDEGSASAIMPIVVRGPGEWLDKLTLIDFDRPFDPNIDMAIERALTRFAQAMPLPPEVVKGIADINHWGSWQVDQNTFKHIEPLAMAILAGITDGYYRPALIEDGMDAEEAEQHLIWYDPAAVVGHPFRAPEANDAHDRLAISDKAYRKVLGFSDDDQPDADETARRIGAKGRPGIEVAELLLQEVLRKAGIDPYNAIGVTHPESSNGDRGGPERIPIAETDGAPDAAPPTSERAPAAPVQASGALTERSGRPLGERLVQIDAMLRARITVAADAAIRRAFEKAGARIRTKATAKKVGSAQRALISQSSDATVAARLGPALVAQLDPPVDDDWLRAFEPMHDQFDAWVSQAQADALELLDLDEEAKAEVEAQQQADLNSAWLWFVAALVALAKEKLYGAELESEGELDPTMLVPAGLVRQAVARAGGAVGLTEASGFVATLEGGPLSGVAFGETIKQALAGKGAVVEGYQWVYGPFPRRTFDPHKSLDGIIFERFTDPRLANLGGFPPYAFFMPGDHAGCVCDLVPVIVAPQIFPEPVIAAAGR